jgi:peptidoglycan DL-endopeptidase CwlO
VSITEIQSRILAIESRFGGLGAATVTAGSGAEFAATLDATLATGTAAGGSTGTAAGVGVSGQAVIEAAGDYLGVPYVWGGEDPKRGLDCSGLTQLVFSRFGIELPRVSRDQARVGERVPNLAAARPGDLLFFDSPVDHVGIYAGDGKMIHAPRPGRVVTLEKVYETPSGIRRVLSDPAPVVASGGGGVAGVSGVTGQGLGLAGVSGPSGHGLGAAERTGFAGLFRAAGARHGVDPALLAAVAKVESGFNARAVSPAGARGLMQIMPGTARGLDVNPFDPAQAVDGAARLLKRWTRDFGSLELALAAYNAGPGAVRRYDGVPPYAETQKYVRKVIAAMGEMR